MVHLLFVLFSLMFMLQSATEIGTVKEARWNNRLIAYVIADEADLSTIEAAINDARLAMEERDLLLVNLGGRELAGYPSLRLSAAEKEMWRHAWQMQLGETCFVLVGKDGAAKAIQRDRLDLPLFSSYIDTMPMRKVEMRERGSRKVDE